MMKKQTKNKKKPSILSRYLSSSKSKAVAFIVVFGVVGAAVLGLTNASTTQLFSTEAEAGTLKQANIVSNSSASNGKVARLYTTGSSTTIPKFSISKAANQIVISGYGKSCSNIAPIVKVQLDGKSAGQVTLSKYSVSNYTLNISVAAGTHSLSFIFTNDYYRKGICDRDAYLDKISVTGEDTSTPVPAPTPSPTPSPTPPPSGGTAQGTLLFDGTRLANFHLIQSAAPDRIQEVLDPLGSGKTVLKFHVCDGDTNNAYQSGSCSAPSSDTPTENPRAQALSPDIIKDGTEYWVHDEILFPTNFPDSVKGWYGVFTTAYGEPYNGSSPVSLDLDDSSDLQLQRNSTYGYDVPWKMHKPLGRWISITIHEKFSSSGFIEMWIDGQQVTFSNGQKILYMQTMDKSNNQAANQVKITNYRQKGTYLDTTLYHRNFKVGTTKAIVEQ